MRDSVRLATDFHLPPGQGPWPVVLIRTPYGRKNQALQASNFVRNRFAFVSQDWRGRPAVAIGSRQSLQIDNRPMGYGAGVQQGPPHRPAHYKQRQSAIRGPSEFVHPGDELRSRSGSAHFRTRRSGRSLAADPAGNSAWRQQGLQPKRQCGASSPPLTQASARGFRFCPQPQASARGFRFCPQPQASARGRLRNVV
jgi:hypothetical protein